MYMPLVYAFVSLFFFHFSHSYVVLFINCTSDVGVSEVNELADWTQYQEIIICILDVAATNIMRDGNDSLQSDQRAKALGIQ